MITIDFETKSYADLKKVGAWAYSEDPTTDVICACWGIDDKPIQKWWPDKLNRGRMMDELERAIMEGHDIEAHNVSFERSIWMNVMVPKYGWVLPCDSQWRDLMAVACYLSLPPALDRLARALGFEPKDPAGGRLITKYSKLYLKTAKPIIPLEDLKAFVKYCAHDVRMEQSIGDELGDLPRQELEVFQLEQEIAMRGIYLDQEGIDAATVIADQRSEELTEEFQELTGLKPTQRDKVIAWCSNEGIKLKNLQADYLEELLEDGDLPSGPVRNALDIRLRINKASTKKLNAMSRQRGLDGRARFQTRYHGAVTGRETGSGFQPLNLSRGFEKMDPDQLVRDIMYGDAKWLDQIYGDAMDAVVKAARYWILAQEGNRLVVGDYSLIEAVVLACLADEQWKMELFREGGDPYLAFVDIALGLPRGTATKATHAKERQEIGKPGELAFGYQGALGAWLKFDSSGRHTDEEILDFCRMWRKEHPKITTFWWALDEAAIAAVRNPGSIHTVRLIAFEMVDEWLTMILPNRKRIWYRDPQLKATMPQWHRPLSRKDCGAGTCDCKPRAQVTYMAQKTGQWQRVSMYGGKEAENATQAVAREILVKAKIRVRNAGYHIILSVYDEIICEMPKGQGSRKELQALMQESPGVWAADWPIKVNTWEGVRYRHV